MCHEAKKIVEHVKKMHKEGERGFEEEFKINKITIIILIIYNYYIYNIRECGSTLYVGMAQGVSFSLYIGIGAKFENTQKTAERRLRTAEHRTVLLETDLKGKRTYPAKK